MEIQTNIIGTKGNYSIWARNNGPWCSWQFGIKTKKEANSIIKKLKQNDKNKKL